MYETYNTEGYVPDVYCCGRCSEPLTEHPIFPISDDDTRIKCERYDPESRDYESALDNAEYPNWLYAALGLEAPVETPAQEPETVWTNVPVPGFDFISVAGNPYVVYPLADYTYNPADMFDEDEDNFNVLATDHEAEFDGLYEYMTAQQDAIERWTDNEPDYCTHAVERWTNSRVRFAYPEPRTEVTVGEHTLTVTDAPLAIDRKRDATPPFGLGAGHGFVDEQLIDFTITKNYQGKFFNFYHGRDGKDHIGLLTLYWTTYVQNNTTIRIPAVMCKHPQCLRNGKYRTYQYNGTLTNRRAMQDFVLTIIRHGNNHGPDWLVARKDFAYLHAENCDTSKHNIEYEYREYKSYGETHWGYLPKITPCNTDRVIFEPVELDPKNLEACYDFIRYHMTFCIDARCKCIEYEEVCEELLSKQSHLSVA